MVEPMTVLTREQYARELCAQEGWPVTDQNLLAIVTWQIAEGSTAQWNPLDTTEPGEPGETPYNTFDGDLHVWNYPSLAEGLNAVHRVLGLDYYSQIRAFASRGDSAVRLCAAIASSAWGTHDCSSVLPEVQANYAKYAAEAVPGSDGSVDPTPVQPDPGPPSTPPVHSEPAPVKVGIVTVRLPELSVKDEGENRETVASIQELLNARVKSGLALDGLFGPKTDAAVRTFQSRVKIGVDGIVGPATWGQLIGYPQ